MSLRAGRVKLSNVDWGRQQRVVAMRRAMRSSVKCSMWDVPTHSIRRHSVCIKWLFPASAYIEQLSVVTHNLKKRSSQVLLAIATIKVTDSWGTQQPCRVLLDRGSQFVLLKPLHDYN